MAQEQLAQLREVNDMEHLWKDVPCQLAISCTGTQIVVELLRWTAHEFFRSQIMSFQPWISARASSVNMQ